jgi:Ca-activated chloride channel family protein
MRLLLLLLLSLSAYASMLDFLTLDKAKEAYERKEYEEASRQYGKLAHDGNSEVLFNLGDSQYRQGKYEEALKSFEQVTDPALQHQRLHNMGNSYAQLGRTGEAIKSYEEALSLEQDPDTQYNLELLKKHQEQQDQQDKKDEGEEKQDTDQPQKGEQDQQDQRQDSQSQEDQDDRRKDQPESSEKESDQSEPEQSESGQGQDKAEQEKDEQKGAQAPSEGKEVPISDMEERKYTRMLDQRGVNTLMLPIDTKGEREDEEHPW